MRIDISTFKECFRTIKAHQDGIEDLRPMNPVLVYNSSNGRFSIQSELSPMNAREHILGADMTTSGSSPADELYEIDYDTDWTTDEIKSLIERYSE